MDRSSDSRAAGLADQTTPHASGSPTDHVCVSGHWPVEKASSLHVCVSECLCA